MNHYDAIVDHAKARLEEIDKILEGVKDLMQERENLEGALKILEVDTRPPSPEEIMSDEDIEQVVNKPPAQDRPHPNTPAFRKWSLKEVRNWVAKQGDAWFKIKQVSAALNITHSAASNRLRDLEGMGVVKSRGNRSSLAYQYNDPKSISGPTHRPRTPDEVVRTGNNHRGGTVAGTGVKGILGDAKTNNQEVNALLKNCIKEDNAKVEAMGSGHIRVRFPNGIIVRVSTTPDPSAIQLIARDLDHARHGRRELVAQGG